MQAKFGSLTDALVASNNIPSRNVDSWTASIVIYAEYGACVEDPHCFEKMKSEGIYPNAATFCFCFSIRALESGQEIHREIPPKIFLEKYFFSWQCRS